MKLVHLNLALAAVALAATSASAAITVINMNGDGGFGNEGPIINSIVSGDLLEQPGVVATENPTGWHGANPNASERLPSLTDGIGPVSGVTGLLNDFEPQPIKTINYALAGPADVAAINVIGGNGGGDGRVFLTFTLEASIDGGVNYAPVGGFVPTLGSNPNGYYQSNASGAINGPGNPGNLSGDPNNPFEETLVSISDDAGALITGATDIRIAFFAVDNTGGQYRDPFDGVNPFTGVDDGLSAAFVAPLIWEVDVVAIPEPSTVACLAAGLAGLLLQRRRAA